MPENIHRGHRQRLKNRFDKIGFEGWSEHEILEFLLFFVFKRRDTNELAHRLIDTCGSLNSVLSAPHSTLTSIDGIGSNTAYYLRSIGEAYSHMLHSFRNGLRLTRANIPRYLMRLFTGKQYECFYAIMLDKNMNVISSQLMFEGSFSSADIDIKDIVIAAAKSDAAIVIAAHNHPSGILAPSETDISTTHLMQESLLMMGAVLYEHYIVSGSECIGILEYLKHHKA